MKVYTWLLVSPIGAPFVPVVVFTSPHLHLSLCGCKPASHILVLWLLLSPSGVAFVLVDVLIYHLS